jgi:hypothetical protein
MLLHPHTRAVEDHTLGFQAEALLQAVFTQQRDLAARAHYTMPRQSARCAAKGPHHLPGASRKSSGTRDVAISGYFAFGNLPDGVAKDCQHRLALYHDKQKAAPSHTAWENAAHNRAACTTGLPCGELTLHSLAVLVLPMLVFLPLLIRDF